MVGTVSRCLRDGEGGIFVTKMKVDGRVIIGQEIMMCSLDDFFIYFSGGSIMYFFSRNPTHFFVIKC